MKNILIITLLLGSITASATTIKLDVDNHSSDQIRGIITSDQMSEIDLLNQVVVNRPHVKLSEAVRVGGLSTDFLIFEANADSANFICKSLGFGPLVDNSILTTESRYQVIGKVEVVSGALSFSPGPFGREILSMTCAKH